jgi:fibro-slime domain-containing protein
VSPNFFPVNKRGFGDYIFDKDDNTDRNYHFTMELKSHFTYQGGEVFRFTGDDDLFVFIAGKLVIDLGGVHEAYSAELRLDDLNWLKKGFVYDFKIFYAERHTWSANFRAYTSIGLLCDRVDR